MNITGQITNSSVSSSIREANSTSGRADSVIQASDLKNKTTVSGTVKSIDGGNVTIDLGDGRRLNAKLDTAMDLVPGQPVAFEVSSGNASRVTLLPLYTNLSQDMTAKNALSQAGMNISPDTLSMTLAMMDEGMNIDKESLGDMYRLMDKGMALGGTAADIVNMKALGLEINEENIKQFTAFKNYENELGAAIEEIAGRTMELYDELAFTDGDKASELFKDIAKLTEGFSSEEIESETEAALNGKPSKMILTEDGIIQNVDVSKDGDKTQTLSRLNSAFESWFSGEEVTAEEAAEDINLKTKADDNALKDAAPKDAAKLLNEKLISILEKHEAPASVIKELKTMPADDQSMIKLFKELDGMLSKNDADELSAVLKDGFLKADIKKLMSSPEMKDVITSALKQTISLKPEDASQKANIEKLYSKMNEEITALEKAVIKAAGTENPAYNTVAELKQNVNFINELNQAIQYVQIPLKMAGSETTGDLYVYTDKKSLASKDGSVSAFLHLDMDNLGPVDVYAAIRNNNNVSTRFYLADDEMIDFIAEHIHILTERLEERGYNISTSCSKRDELQAGGEERVFKDPVKSAPAGLIYAKGFDMRA
ncbi:MAG: flagellar hook-length control protein FliK [Lachnospiraceae bacterium]|nr:flagellar hook-length control protein FliK [Lachnospiraceae bacterium]